jgi:hypothetical protein
MSLERASPTLPTDCPGDRPAAILQALKNWRFVRREAEIDIVDTKHPVALGQKTRERGYVSPSLLQHRLTAVCAVA